METILTARIVTPFHDGVRFERVTRYLLQLHVYEDTLGAFGPKESHQSGVNAGKDATHAKNYGMLDARTLASTEPFVACNPQNQGTQSTWLPSYTSTSPSKKCRCDSLDPTREELDVLNQRIAKDTSSLSDVRFVDKMDLLKQKIVFLSQKLEDSHQQPLNGYKSDSSRIQRVSYEITHDNAPPSSPATPEASVWNNERNSLASKDSLDLSSPVKRKACGFSSTASDVRGRYALDQLEHLDLGVDAKRRKLLQLDEQDAHIDAHAILSADEADGSLHALLTKVLTDPMGDAQTLSIESNTDGWFKKLDQPIPSAAPKPRAATLPGIEHTKSPWKDHQATHGAPLPSHASSSHVDEITPPTSAHEAHSPVFKTTSPHQAHSPIFKTSAPSQEQIQNNYHEFEERMKRKAAEKAYYAATILGFDGIVSPTDENDKSFERIFLEDGETEGWDEDMDMEMDGLSESIESVRVEEC